MIFGAFYQPPLGCGDTCGIDRLVAVARQRDSYRYVLRLCEYSLYCRVLCRGKGCEGIYVYVTAAEEIVLLQQFDNEGEREKMRNSGYTNSQLEEIVAERRKAVADEVIEKKYGKKGDLIMGANIAGFEKVADAMMWQGVAY